MKYKAGDILVHKKNSDLIIKIKDIKAIETKQPYYMVIKIGIQDEHIYVLPDCLEEDFECLKYTQTPLYKKLMTDS